ncbi:MAG: UPF0182 family protein [Gemmatimonadaceae bacterium]
MKRRRWIAVGVACVAALLVLGRAAAGVYVDYLWYAALDASSLWRAQTTLGLATRAAYLLVGGAFLFANLYAVRRSVVSLRIPRRLGNLEIGEEVPGRYLDFAAAGLALLLAFLLTFPRDDWTRAPLAFFGVPFGETDPHFYVDLGFYVYWLPFERGLRDRALVLVLLTAAVVIFLYALTPSLTRERGMLYVSNYVRRHLFALLAVLLLILAWSYRLDNFHLLLDGSGPGGAFTYVDRHANITVNLALSILALCTALIVAWAGWTGQLRTAFIAVAVVMILSLALRQLAPLWVAPGNSTVRERPYLDTRAEYTRRAYAVDEITLADASVPYVSPRELATSLPSWDGGALARALPRGSRTWYPPRVGWQATPSGVAALLPERAPLGEGGIAGAWSIAMLAASRSDARGGPVSIATAGVLAGAAPEAEGQFVAAPVVYDSAAPRSALVRDSTESVAAPSLGGVWSRIAHAWSLQDYRLLRSDARPTTRILTWTDVRARVHRLAPFFTQGTDVTPLLERDTLYWLVELYSASASYPLSQRMPLGATEMTYVRHAATAFVNAQTGRVQLAADSALDPIALTWVRSFPDLFVTRSAADPALIGASPPATDGARIRASAFASVGSRRGAGPRGGHLPQIEGADSALARTPMALAVMPQLDSALAWTTPILDAADRVTGLLIATGGRARRTLWLPLPAPGSKWGTVLDSFRAPLPEASPALPRDARVIRGPVRAAALGSDIVFLQSLYTVRGDAPLALDRVLAATGPQIPLSGRTLADALGVAAPAGDSTIAQPLGPAAFQARVRALYAEMRAATSRGDWAAFGAAYGALGELLARTPATAR